jgi:transcriptional regulator with XRE-family HTH domain
MMIILIMPNTGDMSEALRRAVNGSGLSQRELARRAGVEQASLVRFMNATSSLRLDKAAALAAMLGLELVPVKLKKGKP